MAAKISPGSSFGETEIFVTSLTISHHIMPLVINALGGRHTYRHTNTQTYRQTHRDTDIDTHTNTHTYQCVNKTDFKKPGTSGLWPHMPGLKINFEFKGSRDRNKK